jgi:hypothetical protein
MSVDAAVGKCGCLLMRNAKEQLQLQAEAHNLLKLSPGVTVSEQNRLMY